jgi:3-oxoacyl-[acyl-carrier-protein] synthase II
MTVITGVGLAVAGFTDADDLLGDDLAAVDRTGDPLAGVSRKVLRHKDRATRLALAASARALHDAGLHTGAGTAGADRTGVITSSNFGNLDTVCGTVDAITTGTYVATSPVLLPSSSSNVIASWVAIIHGFRGANLTLCNGAPAGLDALHWARTLIGAGRVDRVLVVGVEPANDVVARLTGGVAVDGAAAVLVESPASAADRGVKTLATLGRHARRGELPDAVAAVSGGITADLWCAPEESAAPTVLSGHRLDLGALGRCSGALGVLQAVAATAWLRHRPEATVLATAGAGAPDAAAALILTGPRLS